jgi:hypothetical protein
MNTRNSVFLGIILLGAHATATADRTVPDEIVVTAKAPRTAHAVASKAASLEAFKLEIELPAIDLKLPPLSDVADADSVGRARL